MPIAKEFYDMMEKFEVYSFNNIYYTLEEIEAMGLFLVDYEGIQRLVAGKDRCSYQVVSYCSGTDNSSVLESKDSVDEFLKYLGKNEKVFMKDCGDYGVAIPFKNFYGIRFQKREILFGTPEQRDKHYFSIQQIVYDELNKIEEDSTIKHNSNDFRKQFEIMNGKNKLLELTHPKEK